MKLKICLYTHVYASMNMYVCIYIYIYMYVYIYVCAYICVYVYISVYVRVYIYVYVYICMCIYVYVYTNLHTYICLILPAQILFTVRRGPHDIQLVTKKISRVIMPVISYGNCEREQNSQNFSFDEN